MKEDKTILLQLISRDEEAAVSSSIMISSFIIERSKIEAHCTSLLWQACKQRPNDQMTYYADFIVFVSSRCDRNDHTTVTAPLPVCSAKLTLSGQVSTTVGDHVGIPGVVLLLILALIADFRFQPRPSLDSFCSNRLVWHGAYDNMYLLCFFILTYA